jgi:hypothetical protein
VIPSTATERVVSNSATSASSFPKALASTALSLKRPLEESSRVSPDLEALIFFTASLALICSKVTVVLLSIPASSFLNTTTISEASLTLSAGTNVPY